MFFFVLAFTLLTLDALWWFWADRRLRPLRYAILWRLAISAFMVIEITGYVWMAFGRFADITVDMPLWLFVIVYLWHLLVLPATMVLLTATTIGQGIVYAAKRLICRPPTQPGELPVSDPQSPLALDPPLPTRRQLLFATAAMLPPLVASGTIAESYHQRHELGVRRLRVPIRDLPPALDGCTIAHISDIHVGTFTAGRKLVEITDVTNRLKADLVMVTGDLIDFSLGEMDNVKEMLNRLDRPDRVFMCEGNHDLFENRADFEGQMADFQQRYGIPMLINESRTLSINGQPVQILGLRWGKNNPHSGVMLDENLHELLPQRKAAAFPILLAHHPHAFDSAAEHAIPLTLSGHTHGGQLMLTKKIGAGPVMFKYWSGLYQKNDGRSALVVSNGAGNWFPLRINAPAEIVHLTLCRITA